MPPRRANNSNPTKHPNRPNHCPKKTVHLAIPNNSLYSDWGLTRPTEQRAGVHHKCDRPLGGPHGARLVVVVVVAGCPTVLLLIRLVVVPVERCCRRACLWRRATQERSTVNLPPSVHPVSPSFPLPPGSPVSLHFGKSILLSMETVGP